MTYNVKTLIAAGCLAFSMGSAVEAQDLGAISHEVGGWAYVPVLNSGDVEAIVAVRTVDSTSPIGALWCERATDGTWSSMAWENVFPEEVASYVLDYVGASIDDDSLDNMMYMWPVDLDPEILAGFMGNPVSPTVFGDGVFVGDVLEGVVYDNPELLQPLADIGYPAVADLSGSSISGGTFGGSGITPERKDDECIAAYERLNILLVAFESTESDLNLISQVFRSEYDNLASDDGSLDCGCPDDTWTLSDTGWVYTCGAWSQNGPPVPGPGSSDCTYKWIRDVSGIRTKVTARTENCSTQTCTQTLVRAGFQEKTTLGVRTPYGACSPTGTPPPAGTTCNCSVFSGASCETSPSWVPARCPWE